MRKNEGMVNKFGRNAFEGISGTPRLHHVPCICIRREKHSLDLHAQCSRHPIWTVWQTVSEFSRIYDNYDNLESTSFKLVQNSSSFSRKTLSQQPLEKSLDI